MENHGKLAYVTRIDAESNVPTPAEGLRKVFISYKKSDNIASGIRDIVARKILDIVNCAVWYDENLTPGISYEQEIIDAISECDAVVLLLTRDILKSDYVWDIEVVTAREQKKGIIPIAFGISAEDYAEAERRLGDKLQILRWPAGSDNSKVSDESIKFDNAFKRALNRFVIDSDLALRAEQFFASGKHKVSCRYLNDDQKYIMGYGYLKGIGVERDDVIGVELLDFISRTYGNDDDTLELKAIAALELDQYYYDIDNFELSFEYSLRGFAADNAEATLRLGYAYHCGEGVEQDMERAAELYEKAADMGNATAALSLALMYDNGEGVEQNMAKAAELYEKAADMGDAVAASNLAMMYYYGEGIEQNMEKAFELYKKAADMGNAEAIFGLGVLYEYGESVEPDVVKAAELYKKASEMGHVAATSNLAGMYKYGDGVEQDMTKAFELYRKAADMGHAEATFRLGELYDNGEGTEQDKIKAAELFEKAAAAGFRQASLPFESLSEEAESDSEAPEESKKLTPKEIRAAKKAEKAAARAAKKEARAAAKAAKRAARKNK